MTPASTRTRDRWTEARTGPCPFYPAMASDHALSRELATTQRAGSHEDPLTASSGRPSERGPSRRTFSTAPAEGLIPLVPTRDIGVHISSPVSSKCLRAKDPLEGTKVAVFPSLCAPQRPDRAAQRTGGHRRVATRKTTGDLTTRRGQVTPRRQMVGYGQSAAEEGTCPGVRCAAPRCCGSGKPSKVAPGPVSRGYRPRRSKSSLTYPGVRTRSAEVPLDLPCAS